MEIDWAAETVYWIERAKSYAIEAGVPEHEISLLDNIKEAPRKAAQGPSIIERALGLSAEEISSLARQSKQTETLLSSQEGEADLCCDNPECPVRASIIIHNKKLKASMN